MPEKFSYEISWGSLWRIVVLVILVWLAYLAIDILLTILLALVIAAGLDAPVSWLKKKGVPRVLSTIMLFIVSLVFIAGIIYTIIPLALSDISQLTFDFSQYSGFVVDAFKASNLLNVLTSRLDLLADSLASGKLPLAQIIGSIFGNLVLAIVILVLTFYLTVGQDGVERFIIAILPGAYEDLAVSVYLKVRKKIGQWLKGQVVLSLAVGFMVFIGLSLLGVKHSLLLAILAGILEIIPFVGPIFSGAIAVLIALSTSLPLALYTLILFVIVQQTEGHVLVPLMVRYTTNLNSAVVLISILIGGKLFGFMGLILAVPASVFIQEIIEIWTISKQRRKGLV